MLPCLNHIIILVIFVNSISCVCEETFWSVCESLDDVVDHDITKKSWTQLVIEPKNPQDVHFNVLQQHNLNLLVNLEQILIIRQLKRIEYRAFDKSYLRKNLKYVVLYGNFLGHRLSRLSFTFDNLRKLSLVNNSIEYIDPCVFDNSIIDTVDLSKNLLYRLSNYMFCKCQLTKLIVRYNKLTKIQSYALPHGLKHLYLDHNNFEVLSLWSLNNTNEIEVLTLSYNQFSFVEDFSTLSSLRKLDLSFNNIHKVGTELDNLKQLRVLNLSGNQMKKFTFPFFITNNTGNHFLIMLAYNRLRNLNFFPVMKNWVTLALFGNPWNCMCLKNMEEIIYGPPPNHVKSIPCGKVMSHSDRIPFCTMINSYYDECNDDPIPQPQFQLFRRLFGTDKCNTFQIFQEDSEYIPPPPIVFGLPPVQTLPYKNYK